MGETSRGLPSSSTDCRTKPRLRYFPYRRPQGMVAGVGQVPGYFPLPLRDRRGALLTSVNSSADRMLSIGSLP